MTAVDPITTEVERVCFAICEMGRIGMTTTITAPWLRPDSVPAGRGSRELVGFGYIGTSPPWHFSPPVDFKRLIQRKRVEAVDMAAYGARKECGSAEKVTEKGIQEGCAEVARGLDTS